MSVDTFLLSSIDGNIDITLSRHMKQQYKIKQYWHQKAASHKNRLQYFFHVKFK